MITNYEIKYYEKHGDLKVKRCLIEASSKQEAFKTFKEIKHNTMIVGIKTISNKKLERDIERILGDRY